MGRLEQSKPWNTRDIVGVFRFLQRVWRLFVEEESGRLRVVDRPADDATRRLLHQTIAAVGDDMQDMRFNTAIAKLIELTNHLTPVVAASGELPREVAEPFVLMLTPMAPHFGEELWARLGHPATSAYEPWPTADPAFLAEEEIAIPVQVNGKLRATIVVATSVASDQGALEAAARVHPNVAAHLDGKAVRKVIVVPGRLVNFVVA
jgi:leucyl-tRNA synthetase